MGSRTSGNRTLGAKRATAGRKGKNKSRGWERQVARRIEAIVAMAEHVGCTWRDPQELKLPIKGVKF